MEKPKQFFYQFPTGGEKFVMWPVSGGSYRLEADRQTLGVFQNAEFAANAASKSFLEMRPDMPEMAEKMLDLDWWERSPANQQLVEK